MTGSWPPPGQRDVVESWVLDRMPSSRIIADHSMPLGEALVLEFADASGSRWIVKSIRSPDHYQQEKIAHLEWVPNLGEYAPSLQLSDDELRLLVLERLPGEIAESVPQGVEPSSFEQAGKLLRRLHRSAAGRAEPEFAARMQTKLERYAERAHGLVGSADLAYARERVAALRKLPAPVLVPCHRDNHPRNWLVDNAGVLRLIDFGMAAWDVWVQDIVRLESRYWRDPKVGERQRKAFFTGYGRWPDETDRRLLGSLLAYAGVSTIVWANDHGDSAFEEQGRRTLADARAADGR